MFLAMRDHEDLNADARLADAAMGCGNEVSRCEGSECRKDDIRARTRRAQQPRLVTPLATRSSLQCNFYCFYTQHARSDGNDGEAKLLSLDIVVVELLTRSDAREQNYATGEQRNVFQFFVGRRRKRLSPIRRQPEERAEMFRQGDTRAEIFWLLRGRQRLQSVPHQAVCWWKGENVRKGTEKPDQDENEVWRFVG